MPANHNATWAEQASAPSTPSSGKWKFYPKSDGFYGLDDTGTEYGPLRTDPVVATDSTDVSNPPTDAELDAAFGTPATVGAGFTALLDDAGGDSNVYLVMSNGTSWWYAAMTKAV